MTLIELMVGLLIGLIISAAVISVLGLADASRRRTMASGDTTQLSAYTQMLLDRWVRSAGSGFMQGSFALGCALHVSRSSTQILPVTGTLPAPFASVNPGTAGVFRLAPVLIASGQTTPGVSGQASDVLIVTAGTGGRSEMPINLSAITTSTTLSLTSGVGLRANDLLLLADRQTSNTGATLPCTLTQVSSTYATGDDGNVALAGTFHASTINSRALTDYSTEAAIFSLGNASDNPPSVLLIGVGNDNTLFSYDLLQGSGTTAQAVADGVFELQALYGVDTSGDGRVDSWQAPTGTYAIASLSDGSAAASANLQRIVALRVGLILRASSKEAAAVAPASLTLFSDLGSTLTHTRTLSSTEQQYRYQTVDLTIPLVNTILPNWSTP
ncbi:type IV pilus assembly protein PilW [Sphaerotilus hippei]|uniref:Type IV pilus assembly protein PilW n=2 Tax=Sphaerotilus hippei TaxID=744406 RepID=A0A318H0P2_9BURK|nr:type IV pilus assembly protein PilW [Sphaerotilus hippei]